MQPRLIMRYNGVTSTSRSYATKGKASDSSWRSFGRGALTWGTLAVITVIGGASVIYIRRAKEQKMEALEREKKRSVGTTLIGGPFDLVDTEGNEVTQDTFLGKWIIMYFGFCNCPDICPDQLDKLTAIIKRVNATSPDAPKLQPLFISVDPKRDTPEQIKEYLKDFHPDMIGLTGTDDQIKRLCKAFRVYYSAGPQDEDDDYIVDHTVILYMMGPDGKFSDYFGQNQTVSQIVSTIQARMFKEAQRRK